MGKRKPAKQKVVEPTSPPPVVDQPHWPERPSWADSVPPKGEVDVSDEFGITFKPIRTIPEDLAEAGPLCRDGRAQPNALHRRIVWDMAAAGCSHRAMAECLDCAMETLERQFAVELATAYEATHAMTIRAAMREAQQGDMRAIEYYGRQNAKFQQKTSFATPSGKLEIEVDSSAEEKAAAADFQKAILAALDSKPAKISKPKTGVKQ